MKHKCLCIIVCLILLVSSITAVVIANGKTNEISSVSIDEILNTNENKIVRVTSTEDFNNATFGDIIFINDNHEKSDDFNTELKEHIALCYPVITDSGYQVFSDAGLSVAYPEDAKYVGYCKDTEYGNNDCKSMVGYSESDSIKGLCDWANVYADQVSEEIKKIDEMPLGGFLDDIKKKLNQAGTTYLLTMALLWRSWYKDWHETTNPEETDDSGSSTWGKVTKSTTNYNTGRGSLNVNTQYIEYTTEDSSRRYFIVHYFVEVDPDEGYRTADIKVISDVDEKRSTQKLERYSETTSSGTNTHSVTLGIGTDGVNASENWEYSISDIVLHSESNLGRNYYEIWYDVNERESVGKDSLAVQPGTVISTDKSDNNGSLKVVDNYKVDFCKCGNSNGDWWRFLRCIDSIKYYNYEYYSTSLCVEIE